MSKSRILEAISVMVGNYPYSKFRVFERSRTRVLANLVLG